MAGGLLDKEANLLLGFQALFLVKVLTSKLVTHLRDIMIAA